MASAGPLTGDVDSLARLEDAGVAAVVLPSLFEEEIVRDSLELNDVLERGTDSFGEALSFFPELDDYGIGPERYLDFVEEAKARLEVPVIASLNADSTGGWVRYAHLLEEGGADALELNMYTVAADASRPGTDVEADLLRLVGDVRAAISIPLAVKLSPYFSSMAHMACRVVEAGADGLVLFNRFYQPDLDLDTLEVVPRVKLSEPWELRLPLQWIAILHGETEASLAASSGITDAAAVAKVLLVGADVAMMTSALVREGPQLVEAVERELEGWLTENEYVSVSQLKGSVSRGRVADPTAFERGNYMRTLTSYRVI